MKLRKLFTVLLALLVILSFAGCGGGGGGSSDDPSGGGNGGNGGEAETTPNYLCFTSTGDSSIEMQIIYGTPEPLPVLEYSTDGTTWEDFVIGTTKVELADGKKVYFRGDNNSFSDGNHGYLNFKISGSIAASGNIMSLLDKACKSVTIPNNYCFYGLFEDCTVLTAAPELPATTLKDYCYGMMFYDCTALTTAPELPATTLTAHCYEYMFQGCSSLNWIKVHFIDNYPFYSTYQWVYGVSDEGTFECPADSSLIADNNYGPHGIPNGWVVK